MHSVQNIVLVNRFERLIKARIFDNCSHQVKTKIKTIFTITSLQIIIENKEKNM